MSHPPPDRCRSSNCSQGGSTCVPDASPGLLAGGGACPPQTDGVGSEVGGVHKEEPRIHGSHFGFPI